MYIARRVGGSRRGYRPTKHVLSPRAGNQSTLDAAIYSQTRSQVHRRLGRTCVAAQSCAGAVVAAGVQTSPASSSRDDCWIEFRRPKQFALGKIVFGSNSNQLDNN